MPFDGSEFDYNDPVLKCLIAARHAIRSPRYWAKCDMYVKGQQRYCMLGAIESTIESPGFFRPIYMFHPVATHAVAELSRAIGEAGLGSVVADFNDHWKTRHKDVMAVFDKAIAKRRALLAAKVAA